MCPQLQNKDSKPKKKPTWITPLLYVQTTYSHLGRTLAKHITGVGQLPRKISSFLCPVKDYLRLMTPGMYSTLCEYGQVYIGHTGLSITTRVKEHHWHIWLIKSDKTPGHQNPLYQL
jgi:hypothetical protein